MCGPDHAVLSLKTTGGDGHVVRRTPCAECPWRKDLPTRRFPPSAFRESAKTAYDMAMSVFACHVAGVGKPQTCAGYMHSTGAYHSLSLRMSAAAGRLDLSDYPPSPFPLFKSYREMAEANGVDPDDPILKPCR
jgi:hypothetical protein